jgi:hypothetical protein
MFKAIAGILTVGGVAALAGTWLGAFILVVVLSVAFGDFATENAWVYWGYIWITFLAAYGGVLVAAGLAWATETERQSRTAARSALAAAGRRVYAVGYTAFAVVAWIVVSSAVLAIPSSFIANSACDHGFARPTLVMDGIPALGLVRFVGGFEPMSCGSLDG